MKISLDNDEIIKAISNYVSSIGINTEGKSIEVSLTVGRKGNGYSADIDIIGSNTVKHTQVNIRGVPTLEPEEVIEEEEEAPVQTSKLFGA